MRKISLDEAWELTMRMWLDPELNPHGKRAWIVKNRNQIDSKGPVDVMNDCFLCEYAFQQGQKKFGLYAECEFCPGKMVDPTFHCEKYRSYAWSIKPEAFKDKLKELYEKYKSSQIHEIIKVFRYIGPKDQLEDFCTQNISQSKSNITSEEVLCTKPYPSKLLFHAEQGKEKKQDDPNR